MKKEMQSEQQRKVERKGQREGQREVRRKVQKEVQREVQRRNEGYLTVEAALLLPFVIGVIVYVIYFQLFWYNRCLMDQETAMTAVRSVQVDSVDMEKIQKEVRQWREEFLTDRHVGWEKEKPVLTAQLNKLSVSAKGSLKLPYALWNAEAAYEVSRINTSVFLRSCRKLILRMEEKT